MDQSSKGVELITAERERQVTAEGWTLEHDDAHGDGSLSLAAICYASPCRVFTRAQYARGDSYLDPWPWEARSDKRGVYGEGKDNPSNVPPDPHTYTDEERVDLLVKAGALIAAEIDRLLRKGS